MDASLTIITSPPDNDLATWLGIFVNCAAVIVTGGVAVFASNEARTLRREARHQALQVASLSMRQALDLLEMIFANVEAAPASYPANLRWIESASAPAVIAANGALARDIPDTGFHHLAMQVQTLAHAIDNDARTRRAAEEEITGANYLHDMEGLRTSTREMLVTLDNERARLGLPRPAMAMPPN